VVYIEEAHAADVWQMESNVRQNVVFANPKSAAERDSVAESCVRKLNIQIPAVVDDFQNTTERAYTGWPDRLYVVDRGGHIAYKSKPGPFGFDPAGVEKTLERLNAGTTTTSPGSTD
jgi:type I thyroxine 5'-deiodinase